MFCQKAMSVQEEHPWELFLSCRKLCVSKSWWFLCISMVDIFSDYVSNLTNFDGLARPKGSRAGDAAMLVFFVAAAFITGYVLRSFQTMLLIYATGVVLTYHSIAPLQWFDPSEAEKYPKPQPANSGPKKKVFKK